MAPSKRTRAARPATSDPLIRAPHRPLQSTPDGVVQEKSPESEYFLNGDVVLVIVRIAITPLNDAQRRGVDVPGQESARWPLGRRRRELVADARQCRGVVPSDAARPKFRESDVDDEAAAVRVNCDQQVSVRVRQMRLVEEFARRIDVGEDEVDEAPSRLGLGPHVRGRRPS